MELDNDEDDNTEIEWGINSLIPMNCNAIRPNQIYVN